jgi:hypothetical protein
MSRNKQVDKLRKGLQEFWIGKISDPVTAALNLIKTYRKSQVKAAERTSEFKQETKNLFEALHIILINAGYAENVHINRRNAEAIKFGELGFVNKDPQLETKEDKALLITLTWLALEDIKIRGELRLKNAEKETNKAVDILEADITNEQNYRHESEIRAEKLRDELRDAKVELDIQAGVLKDLTEQLSYQVSATRQYKRELELLRNDDIERNRSDA